MADVSRRARRFRTRLTAVFVLTAAVTSGALAVATYGLTREYRQRNFRESSRDEVKVALALAPRALDEESFERIVRVYGTRTGSDAIVVDGEASFSSSAVLDQGDIPDDLFAGIGEDLRTATTVVAGREYLVVVGLGPNGEQYAFFFGLDQLHDSLVELRTVLAASWVVIVLIALAVGEIVARTTLRPVRQAADAAAAIASGKLDTRIASTGADEFAQWARSFNVMAETLQSKIAELDRAAARERQFTADIAHDLRTPLTAMSTMAALLDDQLATLPADARTVAAILIQDTRRLTDLILELLELAQLDAKVEDVAAEQLNLRELVQQTVASLRLDERASVSVDIPSTLFVMAERTRFRRAFGNLVQNGVHHGGGAVEITASAETAHVLVHVRDHGPGIEPGDLGKVFDRFFRGDASRARGGSGLGLAIAREQALAQQGDLVAANDPDGGAIFTLRLPRSHGSDDGGLAAGV